MSRVATQVVAGGEGRGGGGAVNCVFDVGYKKSRERGPGLGSLRARKSTWRSRNLRTIRPNQIYDTGDKVGQELEESSGLDAKKG